MAEWYTIEQFDEQTYVISEYKHYEETHCYLLCGSLFAVLIDTGLGVENLRLLTDRLTSLPILVLTTHVHWDHIGSHRWYDRWAVHESEAAWLNGAFPLSLSQVKANLLAFPCDFPPTFDPHQYQLFQEAPSLLLHDGDQIDLGNRRIEVIHTPGHSPGHCCFYEADRQWLYSGDLVYEGCLDIFYPTTEPLQFYQSIQKIKHYPLQRILPGHHKLSVDCLLIDEIEMALTSLAKAGKLCHGSGIFTFDRFQLHL